MNSLGFSIVWPFVVAAVCGSASAQAISGRSMQLVSYPVVGRSMQFRLLHPPSAVGIPHAVWWSAPFPGTATVSVSGLATLGASRIDLASARPLFLGLYPSTGDVTYALAVPANPTLAGFAFDLQSVDLDAVAATLAFADNDLDVAVTAGVWTTPSSASSYMSLPTGDTGSPALDMNRHGDAMVAWIQREPASNLFRLLLAEHRGGAWSIPGTYAQAFNAPLLSTNASRPNVVLDDSGNALLAWRQYVSGSQQQIFLAEYRNSTWTKPSTLQQHISVPGMFVPSGPEVVMNDQGHAIITWRASLTGGGQRFDYMSERSPSGSWQHPTSSQATYLPLDLGGPTSIAMNADGDALLTYAIAAPSFSAVFFSQRTGGVWQHPTSLGQFVGVGPPSGVESPRGAIADNGDAVIVWTQNDPVTALWRLFLSHRRNGVWAHPATWNDAIGFPGLNVGSEYSVAMTADGKATIAWIAGSSSQASLYVSSFDGVSWHHPATVANALIPVFPVSSPRPVLSLNRSTGTASLTWIEPFGAGDRMNVAQRWDGVWSVGTAGPALGPSAGPIYYSYEQGRQALGSNEQAVVIWLQDDGTGALRLYRSEFR